MAIATIPKSAGASSRTTMRNEAQLRIWLNQSDPARHARLRARDRSILLDATAWEANSVAGLPSWGALISRESTIGFVDFGFS